MPQAVTGHIAAPHSLSAPDSLSARAWCTMLHPLYVFYLRSDSFARWWDIRFKRISFLRFRIYCTYAQQLFPLLQYPQ